MLFPLNPVDSKIASEVNEIDELSDLKSTLKTADIGADPWWNGSFIYRRLINITNPHAEDLEDTIVSITFNYSEYVDDAKMNSSVKDVRIIENNVIRNYIIQIDYPTVSLATVWFETNLSASTLEQDTYMYYGNNTVEIDSSNYNKNNRFGTNWWTLDGDYDDSFGNHNGTPQNTPTFVSEGKVGGSVNLVRSSLQHIEFLSFDCGDTFIVAGWVKWISTGGTFMPWGLDRDSGTDIDPWHAGGHIYNNRGDSYSNPYLDDGAYVPYPTDGEWHHYVWENIGGSTQTSKFWIDGQLAGTANYNNPTSTNKQFQISCWPRDNSYHWNGEIDDVRIFQYGLSANDVESIYNLTAIPAELNEEQYKGIVETLEVTVYDVDGRIVPNAHVSLVNMSVPEVVRTGETGDDGSITFTKIPAGTYNFTVKYNDTSSGMEYPAYNSTEENWGTPDDDMYTFTKLNHEIDVHVNLWTIDFEIDDWDGDPFNYAYINVSDDPGGTVVDTLHLNEDGLETFIWENRSHYYYEVYYNNSDYYPKYIPTALNASYINRTVYNTKGQKYFDYKIFANETMTYFPLTKEYIIDFRIYTDGNSSFNYNKLIGANITLTNMEDSLEKVKIHYIDREGQSITDDHLIYYNQSYSGGTEDFIPFNIRKPPSTPNGLIQDNFEAYGLHLHIEGTNSTQNCNGIIEINMTEACHVFNSTDLSKIKIRVIDNTLNDSVSQVIIHVLNITDPLVDLITDISGYAYGITNNDVEFWYKRGHEYNFSVEYFGNPKPFNITYADPAFSPPTTYGYYQNYTLERNSTLIFQMNLDPSNFATNFTSSSGDSSGVWGQNLIFNVTFEFTENGGSDWTPITTPDSMSGLVKSIDTNEIVLNKQLNDFDNLGPGQFSLTINSSKLSAGNLSKSYTITISGSKEGYSLPAPAFFGVTIQAKPTDLSVHNYYTLNEYSNMQTSIHALTNIKLAVKYHSSGLLLNDSILTYIWQFGSGEIEPHPSKPGYYFFNINSALITNVGTYKIEISAFHENYSKQENVGFNLHVIRRPTLLNGTDSLLHNSTIIWVQDSYNYTYNFIDLLSTAKVGIVDKAYYYWYKIDENGNPIGAISDDIDLSPTTTNEYLLDFNTKLRSVGSYAIFVSFEKNYYESRNAYIDLRIKKREFNFTLESERFTEDIISVYNGDPLSYNLSLFDLSRNIPLTGANLTTYFQNESYAFTEEGNGVYSINIADYVELNADDISKTFTAVINISKANFTTQTTDITVILQNKRLNTSLSEEFEGQLLTIVSGDSLSFDIILIDYSTASALVDATITIRIGGEIYEDATIVDNGDGTYTITLESYPEAFFTSQTITGEIIIEQENFRTETISFTVKIEMTEIFPGFPMFYFLMIVGSVVAIVGSLATYRIVQQRRIPTFVKKAKTMKKSIKGNKAISDSLLYPSKEEFIAKKLGEKWEAIGLSLEDILGVKEKKMKLSEAKEPKVKEPKAKKPKKKETEIKEPEINEPEIKEPEKKEEFKGGAD